MKSFSNVIDEYFILFSIHSIQKFLSIKTVIKNFTLLTIYMLIRMKCPYLNIINSIANLTRFTTSIIELIVTCLK
jgi:hypothetical protein